MRRAWTSLAVIVVLGVPSIAGAASFGGPSGSPPPPPAEGCVWGESPDAEVVRSRDADEVELDETVVVTPNVRVDGELEPGVVFTCSLVIRNRLSEPATFRLEPYGVIGSTRANAAYEFVDEGDDRFARTAGGWIEPETVELQLTPREVVRVPVRITVPEEPPVGSAFGSLNVTSRVDATDGETVLGIETQRATIFLLRVGGDGAADLELDDVEAPRVRWNRDAWRLTANLDNEGTLDASAAGRVRVRSIFGRTVVELPLQRSTILPGGRDRVDVTWDGVPWFGLYRYDVRVENEPAFEGDDAPRTVATAGGWFVALPPWWVLAIIAAVLLALVWRWWRGRGADDAWHDEDSDLGIEDHELGG